jgi:phosphatidylserine/phosphatidylglycerophosphate/cardiolipin synthase-like enzyme
MKLTQQRIIIGFIGLLIISLACSQTGIPTQPPSGSSDWYTLYFTDPGGPNSDSQRGGPDAALAEAISQAQLSIDLAIYDLNLWSIRDALLYAHQRGIAIRVVTESDNLDRPELQALQAAGISILGDRHQSLMHNKFIIIDGYQVWNGSMNLTLNGAYHNNNNLIRINSTRLAENFTAEFEEMFIDDLFTSFSPANTPHPVLTLEGTQIETFFAPDDAPQTRIAELINSAQHSVHIMAFAFTADPIAQAVISAHQRGLQVSGVIETGQAENSGSDFQSLVDAGVDLRLDGNPRNMHHKVIIIDDQIVIFGSYNFSRSAEERNDENLLIIHSAELAAEFEAEFELIYKNAQEVADISRTKITLSKKVGSIDSGF